MKTHASDRDVVETALAAAAGADEALVSLARRERGWVRFGANEIRHVGESSETTVSVEAAFGTRHGSSSGNDLSPEGIARVAERALEAARRAPEDAEWPGVLGPQAYDEIGGADRATAALPPVARAEAANRAIDHARERGLDAAGYVETSASRTVLATSRGLRADDETTNASYTITMRTPDDGAAGVGSGWGAINSFRFADLDTDAASRRAADHAEASRDPQPVEPRVLPVVLEPDALADLVHNLVFAMDARSAEEGRSFASAAGGTTRLGERLFSELVTIASDPAGMGGARFDGDGLPAGAVTWVRDGALAALRVSRSWAKKTGRAPTPGPASLRMRGGSASLEELAAGIDEGLWIPRIHYIRSVDPSTVLLTGLTRDGVRRIRGGKLAEPVKNLRWTQSVVELLASVEALGRTRRLVTYEFGAPIEVPAVRARAFHFTGVTDSV